MGRVGRVVVAGLVGWVPAGVCAGAAGAAPVPVEKLCTVGDERIDELSGLVAVEGGYVAVNDGSDEASHRRVFFLDARCRVTRAVRFPSKPTDTEDLAVAPDGTLWIGDIGSNDAVRKTIGLWKLSPGADEPVLYRVSYPEEAHNAETLVLDGDGTPVIITKEPFVGEIFVPSAPLGAGRTVPLRSAGLFRIPGTSTSNPHGFAGRFVLTGGATSADGRKVALRTYADAFEIAVTDGDVVAALTTGTATAVALPDEPQGEALTYARDGSSLVTASEGADPALLRYPSALTVSTPTPSPSVAPDASAAPAAEAATAPPKGLRTLVVAGGAVGAALIVAGLIGVLLARRADR